MNHEPDNEGRVDLAAFRQVAPQAAAEYDRAAK
jgi:hypothetical protein